MKWFYAHNGSRLGPVSDQELSALAASGTLGPESLVWKDGMADWQPLATAAPTALSPAGVGVATLGGAPVPPAQKDILVQQMREGVPGAGVTDQRFAGFWIRFLAKVIDGLILLVPNFAVSMGVGALLGSSSTGVKPGDSPSLEAFLPALISFVVNMLVTATYTVLLTSKYGATWGKMALGLKVITEQGGSLSFGRAVGRWLAEFVSSFTLLIGYIIVAFDSQKRALHDHICSTRVIRVR